MNDFKNSKLTEIFQRTRGNILLEEDKTLKRLGKYIIGDIKMRLLDSGVFSSYLSKQRQLYDYCFAEGISREKVYTETLYENYEQCGVPIFGVKLHINTLSVYAPKTNKTFEIYNSFSLAEVNTILGFLNENGIDAKFFAENFVNIVLRFKEIIDGEYARACKKLVEEIREYYEDFVRKENDGLSVLRKILAEYRKGREKKYDKLLEGWFRDVVMVKSAISEAKDKNPERQDLNFGVEITKNGVVYGMRSQLDSGISSYYAYTFVYKKDSEGRKVYEVDACDPFMNATEFLKQRKIDYVEFYSFCNPLLYEFLKKLNEKGL